MSALQPWDYVHPLTGDRYSLTLSLNGGGTPVLGVAWIGKGETVVHPQARGTREKTFIVVNSARASLLDAIGHRAVERFCALSAAFHGSTASAKGRSLASLLAPASDTLRTPGAELDVPQVTHYVTPEAPHVTPTQRVPQDPSDEPPKVTRRATKRRA